ncbi:MAG: CPXCG motif-containing cysteine-rich protein [Nitrospinae bacterium]|nr:CPXCG motif-containing cysteine-rich protein [Nitrospinota bacterium]
MEQREHFFFCPHCGESISMLLDLSEPDQKYIEDCEVCCHPIEVKFATGTNGDVIFEESRVD